MIFASIFHSLVNQMFRSLVSQLVHHHLSIKCVDHLSVSLSIITCQSNVSITCQRNSWTNEIGFFSLRIQHEIGAKMWLGFTLWLNYEFQTFWNIWTTAFPKAGVYTSDSCSNVLLPVNCSPWRRTNSSSPVLLGRSHSRAWSLWQVVQSFNGFTDRPKYAPM